MDIPSSDRSVRAIKSVENGLRRELSQKNLNLGSPVFIRILKHPGDLEVWVENKNGQYDLFNTYKICAYSGVLGPKTKEGDRQAPEGFYFVKPNNLNPQSNFFLSFNLGYPNQYDRFYGRTGSALMVHGSCVSVGCFAMTNAYIKEIYTLVHYALKSGQVGIPVHVFPFKLNEGALDGYEEHEWFSFWKNLQQGYLLFEEHLRPPVVEAVNGQYQFKNRL